MTSRVIGFVTAIGRKLFKMGRRIGVITEPGKRFYPLQELSDEQCEYLIEVIDFLDKRLRSYATKGKQTELTNIRDLVQRMTIKLQQAVYDTEGYIG